MIYILIQGKTTDALSKLISLQPTTAVLVHMDSNKQEKRYMHVIKYGNKPSCDDCSSDHVCIDRKL